MQETIYSEHSHENQKRLLSCAHYHLNANLIFNGIIVII